MHPVCRSVLSALFSFLVLWHFPAFSQTDPALFSYPAESEKAKAAPSWDVYHSNEELETILQDIEARHPALARTFQFGKSVQGRKLLGIEISRNVHGCPQGKPATHLVANVHGDEVIGRELLLRLAWHLTESYASGNAEAQLQRLMENTRIFLIPCMNPDGFELKTRANAQGVDLNRDFPEFQEKDPDTAENRAPETAAFMDFMKLGPQFTLSSSLHGGILLAVYPHSANNEGPGQYKPSPDDALYIQLSKNYASTHPKMHQNKSFPGGIVNGAAWYSVWNGMMDYKYVYHGCLDITLELGPKWPEAATLGQEWDTNRQAMLNFLSVPTWWGVKGNISGPCGCPLPGAKIIVEGIAMDIPADRFTGDYCRLLTPGQYTLRAIAHGYSPSEPVNIVIPKEQKEPMIVHFRMK